MNISFWNTGDEPNRILKSLPTVTPVSGTIRDPGSVDVLNPVILVAGTVDPNVNYCYIDVFDRYYWVRSTSFRNGLTEITCSVDVLMSYASDILALHAIAARAQTENDQYSSYLIDREQRMYTYKTICTRRLHTFSYSSSYVLITAG
jgi:hypothetical protein